MTNGNDSLGLEVTVPAEEWAYMKRRAQYLEAVLLQVLRDKGKVREWFTSADLAALRLPGLPASKAAVTRLAHRAGWRRRERLGRGGPRFEYHVTNLPPRAFDHLVRLIVEDAPDQLPDQAPQVPEPAPELPAPQNTTEPWMLPLMRIIRTGHATTMDATLAELAEVLPPAVELPSREALYCALERLGVALAE